MDTINLEVKCNWCFQNKASKPECWSGNHEDAKCWYKDPSKQL